MNKAGDWIRFMRDGHLVIGEIAYIQHRTCGYVYYVTDIGEVRAESVLEVRAK